MLESLLTAIGTNTGLTIYPFATDSVGECIVYQWNPESDDGVKAQDRVMVRIKASSMAHAIDYTDKVKKAVLTIGDSPKNGYLKADLNGGGTLLDYATNLIEVILYIDLTKRSEAIS